MTRTFRTIVLGLFIAFAAVGAGAQQRDTSRPLPAGQGVIAGTVVASDSGRAVRGADVQLAGGGQPSGRHAVTDASGAFSFEGLTAGAYTLSVSKGGYLPSVFGQRQPGSGRPGTEIQLGETDRMERVSLILARGGAITGAVRDENGEPAFGMQVRAYRRTRSATGEPSFETAGSDTTDDRGVYRIPVLHPGAYLVCAVPRATTHVGTITVPRDLDVTSYSLVLRHIESEAVTHAADLIDGYAPVFYPAAERPSEAQPVLVPLGGVREGVDIQLRLQPTATISGIVVGPEGPLASATVRLVSDAQVPGLGERSARSNASGQFTFSGVPPGQYELVAWGVPRGRRPLEAGAREAMTALANARDEARAAEIAAAIAAATPLSTSQDLRVDGRNQENLLVTLQEGQTIAGRVVFEGLTGAPLALSRMSVRVQPDGTQGSTALANAIPPAPVGADGSFAIAGVPPGRYRVVAGSGVPSGFHLESSVFGSIDTLDTPLDVGAGRSPAGGVLTFTKTPSALSGELRRGDGTPATEFTVVVYAVNEAYWTPPTRRIVAARPNSSGRYTFDSLPPGEYRLAAVTDVENGAWFEPEFLRQLAGASVPVTIRAGERKVQDLVLR